SFAERITRLSLQERSTPTPRRFRQRIPSAPSPTLRFPTSPPTQGSSSALLPALAPEREERSGLSKTSVLGKLALRFQTTERAHLPWRRSFLREPKTTKWSISTPSRVRSSLTSSLRFLHLLPSCNTCRLLHHSSGSR